MHTIKNEKKNDVWVLVKVPRITSQATGADATIKFLRETIRDRHFGGEKAVVRKLTEAEMLAVSA